MRLIWLLATLVVLASAGTLKDPPKLRYDNYRVYQLSIKNEAQLMLIAKLSELSQKYDIWRDYDEHSKLVDIMVNPSELNRFQLFLKLYGISSELLISNVQELIDGEQVASRDSGTFGWKRYYSLDEIEAWLDGLLAAYPIVTEGFTVGKSYEGRTIRGIKIAHGATAKPGIFIESNIHAREWITSATATWFINELLTSEKPEVRNLANSYDWYIVPVFNVDGFEYSHQTNRMWRKTRQPHPTNECIGADPNRNFDSHWMVNNGASNNPCSETFGGTVAWSEPEIKAMSDYLTSIRDKFSVYISFHSYGQYLLSPYGHTKEEVPENYDDLLAIGEAFSDAIKSLPYGTEYVYGSTSKVLYVASGSSVDWVFNELEKKVGFTIEFRDKGKFGFILPPAYILPNCDELLAGMLALIEKTKNLGYI